MTEGLRNFLGPVLLALHDEGEKLVAANLDNNLQFSDHSFLIFPFAKVYEGFLKKLFLSLGAITENQYHSDHWRVGKALNPQLETALRGEESVYDRILNLCNDSSLPDVLWDAWKNGRNRIFHYFPGQNQSLSLEQAKAAIDLINSAMEKALESCRIKTNGTGSD